MNIVRTLVKAVHVKLSDKGREAVVLEEARQDFVAESDVVGHCKKGRE